MDDFNLVGTVARTIITREDGSTIELGEGKVFSNMPAGIGKTINNGQAGKEVSQFIKRIMRKRNQKLKEKCKRVAKRLEQKKVSKASKRKNRK